MATQVDKGKLEPADCFLLIEKWDMMLVRRYMTDRMGYEDGPQLDAMEVEYKRFMALCAACATVKDPMIMTSAVDPMWHAHILFTKDYEHMCALMGSRYLHHDPAFPEELPNLGDGYENTMHLYRVNFGEPNKHFWPAFAQICGGSGCSCSGTGND